RARTYTLLLAHSQTQAEMNADELRSLLRICAKNEGSWFASNKVKGVERHKFKHIPNFLTRVLEYLVKAHLLDLEAHEYAKIQGLESSAHLLIEPALIDPDIALHTERLPQVCFNPPESDEAVENGTKRGEINSAKRTIIQESFNFDAPEPLKAV